MWIGNLIFESGYSYFNVSAGPCAVKPDVNFPVYKLIQLFSKTVTAVTDADILKDSLIVRFYCQLSAPFVV